MINKLQYCLRIIAAAMSTLAAAGLYAPAQTLPPPAAQGNISGMVYGPNSKPLAGTKVWANLVSAVPRTVDRRSGLPMLSAVTRSDGSFSLPYVPDGDYTLCASNPAASALNPCTWGGATHVKVTNGLHAGGNVIQMSAGAPLQVILDDPAGLLAANSNRPGASVIIGVLAPYSFMPLPIAGSTATGRNYQMLVPFGSHTLMVSTQYFKLTDSSGAAISAPSQNITVSVPSGTPGAVIRLRVASVGN